MQFLSRVFDRALTRQKRTAVILGATSGDTGSAALEAFKGRDSVDVFILFPNGRVVSCAAKQMTSISVKALMRLLFLVTSMIVRIWLRRVLMMWSYEIDLSDEFN